jgi:hypothetical protein
MCKYILIGLIVALVVLMVVSAVVVQEYGWTGFLILLGGLVLLAFAGRWIMPRLFRHLLMRPFRKMGAALQGARIVVHSVTPSDPPPPEEHEPTSDDFDGEDPNFGGAIEDDDEVEEEIQDEEPAVPLDWYVIEFTVIPRDAGPSAGRVVNRQAWSPGFISAVAPRSGTPSANPFRGWPSPEMLEDTQVQCASTEFVDEDGIVAERHQVFGEGRLRIQVGVARNISAVTITYAHFTDIGIVPIPRIDVRSDSSP